MVYVYLQQDSADVSTFGWLGGEVAVYSNRNPSKQTPNEDAVGLLPFRDEAGVIAVADGLGGSRAGGEAARLTIEALQEALQEGARRHAQIRTAIIDGIENANRRVLALGIGAATTLVVAEIHDGHVRPYHIGDSMILVVGQRGRVKCQTVPHSPVGFAVEAGVLDAAEAMHHAYRHLVSNVVGSTEMRIEVGARIRLAPRDTVLLSSDGLFDNLHVEEIIERVRKGLLPKAVQTLADDARDRMTHPRPGHPCKPDDTTLVAFRLAKA